MKSVPIENINALAELERLKWAWSASGDNEVSICCPVHKETNPSALLNTDKNLWKCQVPSCSGKGDIVNLLCHITLTDRNVMLADLSERYDLYEVKALNPSMVETLHEHIWEAGPLLKALYDRGLTDGDIRRAKLGFNGKRITIPVYDEKRNVVNVRKYLPGAPGPEKMINTSGYSKPRIYQIEDVVQFDSVWLLGGECKAIVARRLLNPHGIGACSITAGEGSWEHEFGKLFQGKNVYVAMDVDKAGTLAARKLAEKLISFTKNVYIINLPLDIKKYPKGDINDFVGNEGATDKELLAITPIPFTRVVTPQEQHDLGEVNTKLLHAARSENVGRKICLEAVVHAKVDPPYIVPKNVGIECTRDQPNCEWCPVMSKEPDDKNGLTWLTVKGTSPGLLQMIAAPIKQMRDAMREALGVPVCKVAEFTVKDHLDVVDVRLSPQITTDGSNADHVVLPAYIVDRPVDINTPYKLTGRVYPHPKNQQAILLLDEVTVAADSLDCFDDSDMSELKILQPVENSLAGIQMKLDEIYSDYEANVTNIYQRRDFHLSLDLMYHSVLYMEFDGKQQNGWVNVIAVGDSGQGKSEASTRMRDHIGLGERVDCKTASVAGLLGGVQDLSGRWFVTWGVIPMHDRRAVILEEVKGASTETLGTLTDMRSSGKAQINKIAKHTAYARTRLYMMTNARGKAKMSDHNFGCEAILEVMGSLEDVRRFDVGIILSENQINAADINKLKEDRPTCEHTYTSVIARKAVLWAWTRKRDQVIIDPDAQKECIYASNLMFSKFDESMPLVDKGTMKYKLARLATALAARLYSTTNDGKMVMVKKCHVEYVAAWIDRMYSDKHFGYVDYSRAKRYQVQVIDPNIVRRNLLATKHPADLVENITHATEININDVMDWTETDFAGAQQLLSFLVRKHALYRVKRWYVKTSEFIELLKQMRIEGIPTEPEIGEDRL